MDTLVLFHTCPHPLERRPDLSAQAGALRDLRRSGGLGRRSQPAIARRRTHAASRTTASTRPVAARGTECMIRESPLAAEAARYRKVVPAGDYWIHVVGKGETLPHRRSRRQSGRRHAVLQSRRSGRALFGRRHHSRAGQHLSRRTGTVLLLRSLPADADHHRRHRAAATTRSAAPARPRATPCATRSRRSRCMPAATAFCSRSPRTSITG